jgi:hypothetical protein
MQSSSSFDESSTTGRSSGRRKLPAVPEGVDPFQQSIPGNANNSASFDAARLRRMASLTSASKSASADDALYGRKMPLSLPPYQQQQCQPWADQSTNEGYKPPERPSAVAEESSSRRGQGSFVRSKSADEKTNASVLPVYSTRPSGAGLYDLHDEDEEMNAFVRKRSQSLQPEPVMAATSVAAHSRQQDATREGARSMSVGENSSRQPKKPPPLLPPRPTPPAVPPKPASVVLDRRAEVGLAERPMDGDLQSISSMTVKSSAISVAAEPDAETEGSEGDKSPDFSDTPTIVRRPGSSSAQREKANAYETTTSVAASPAAAADEKKTEKRALVPAKDAVAAAKGNIEPPMMTVKPEIPPKPPRLRHKESTAPTPAASRQQPPFSASSTPTTMVTVCRGLEVPDVVYAIQQRVKDEIKIVTATTRLRIDEAEEVRIMEAELAERVREQEKKRQRQRAAATALAAHQSVAAAAAAGLGEIRDIHHRRAEQLPPIGRVADLEDLIPTEFRMSRYADDSIEAARRGVVRGSDDEDFRLEREMALAATAAPVASRMPHYQVTPDVVSYRQRGGGSESDSATYDFRFPPIEEDFGALDENEFDDRAMRAAARSVLPAVVDDATNPDVAASLMFSPKSIYLGTSALQVRGGGGDRKSPALTADDHDPWSAGSSSLRERNFLSRSTDLLKSSSNCATFSPLPSVVGVPCRRSASSSAMAAELTSSAAAAAVAAELNADDADDFYRQLYRAGAMGPAAGPVSYDRCGSDYRVVADMDRRNKEEKLLQLQMEIERRRRHLFELSQNELRTAVAAGGGGGGGGGGGQHHRRDNGTSSGMAADWQQKNFGSGSTGVERYKYQTLPARTSLQSVPAVRPQPQQQSQQQQSMAGSGVIKPLDYQIDIEKYYLQSSVARSSSHNRQQAADFNRGIPDAGVAAAVSSAAIYSSYEYLAHRATEFSPTQHQHQQQMMQRSQQQQQQQQHHHRHQSTTSASSSTDDYGPVQQQTTTGSSRSSSFPTGGGTLDRLRRDDSSERVLGADPNVQATGSAINGTVGGNTGAIAGDRFTYSTSEDSLAYCSSSAGGGAPTMNHAGSRDSGVSSSLTGGDIYSTTSGLIAPSSSAYVTRPASVSAVAERSLSTTSAMECFPPSTSPPSAAVFDELYAPERPAVIGRYQTTVANGSGYETTTPAMPILDDVTSRSRNLLRDIGSRPLSDDVEKYYQAEG